MNYVIFVRNPEESKRVQEILFAAGYVWCCSAGGPEYVNANFIYVKERGVLKTGCEFNNAAKNLKTGDIPLDFNMVAKTFPPLKPEKMISVCGKEYSESTLDKMAKAYTGS